MHMSDAYLISVVILLSKEFHVKTISVEAQNLVAGGCHRFRSRPVGPAPTPYFYSPFLFGGYPWGGVVDNGHNVNVNINIINSFNKQEPDFPEFK